MRTGRRGFTEEVMLRNAAMAKERARVARESRWEDIADMQRAGEEPVAIAARLGTTPSAIARQAYRHGRLDIARLFGRVYSSERRSE